MKGAHRAGAIRLKKNSIHPTWKRRKLQISVGDRSVIVDIGKLITQEHIQQRIIEETVDIPIPHAAPGASRGDD